MAFCDYHPCDLCGENKTFYDANMHYGHDASGILVYGGYEDAAGVMVGGHRAWALCPSCLETHQIVIVPRERNDGR